MSEKYRLIHTVDDLHHYLTQALKIEHATIPPYLTALYSIKPGTNLEAFHIIRSVVVEEMLHLCLVANVLNAVGGSVGTTLTDSDFVPQYPACLPTGETEFTVSLQKFSIDAIDTFLNIERSKEVNEDAPLVLPRPELKPWLRILGLDKTYTFYSIGLFYTEVIRGLQELHQKIGDDLFKDGKPEYQISREYYYDGAGEIVEVNDIDSAIRALRIIQEQGEGSRQETIYDAERELCHYYRFQQLKLGRYYQIDKIDPRKSDSPNNPTGETFTVDWDAVYPIKTDPELSNYPEDSQVYDEAIKFQNQYLGFLGRIQTSFNGKPEKLIPAVAQMFKLKESIDLLIRNPIPNMEGVNAAPIYHRS